MKKPEDSKLFLTELYPQAEKSLPTKGGSLQSHIHKYIDSNNEVLYDIGPSKRLFFSDSDKDVIYAAVGMSDAHIKECIKKCSLIDASWKVLNNPFNLASVLAIRYYQVNKKPKELEATILYFAFSLYSSIQYKYFKYEPNENIMAYTINNLSNKFKLKQTGNMFQTIHSTAMKNHETYTNDIIKGTDLLLKDYIMSLKTRLDGLIQKIANEFYEVREQGKYLNTEEDNYDKDNFYLTDNTSFIIAKTTDAAVIKLLTKGIDLHLVKLAANICGVSVNALHSAVVSIVDKKDKDVKELFSLILQLYLENGQHHHDSIKSKEFVNFCLEIYVKSNTNNQTIIDIKDLLDDWLTLCSPNYVKTERLATKNNFRKATMLYFIFVLQASYSYSK